MKASVLIWFVFFVQYAMAQNIAITGTINNADTVKISVMHESEIVSAHRTSASVYSIFLGEKEFYTIRFEVKGRPVKYLHVFCYKIEKPLTIIQNVNFNNRVNMLLRIEKGGASGGILRKKKLQYAQPKEFRNFWGEQAAWKKEF